MSAVDTIFKDRKGFIEFCKPYAPEAFSFVMAALEYCQKELSQRRHVSGKELLDGICDYGIKEYGPMAKDVIEHWGINASGDFGVIVFKLIEVRVLSKSDTDTLEEFKDVFMLDEVFTNDIAEVQKTIQSTHKKK